MSQTMQESPAITHATIHYYDGPSPADPRTGTAAGSANREANPQLMPVTDIRSLLFQPSPAFTLDTHRFHSHHTSQRTPIPTLHSGQLESYLAFREHPLPGNRTSRERSDGREDGADSRWDGPHETISRDGAQTHASSCARRHSASQHQQRQLPRVHCQPSACPWLRQRAGAGPGQETAY